jgi:hypothetical protein
MKKYRFYPVVYASMKTIEVEANNKEEALEKAMEEFEPKCLCWQCSNDFEVNDTPIDSLEYIEEIEE